MANDNILEIGATVDLSAYLPKIDAMVASTKVGTGAMAGAFQQLATATASSTLQMTTAFISVPAAAQEITPAVKKVEVTTEESTRQMATWWERLALAVKSAAVSITGSLSEVGAKMSETAERSRLGVGTMETAFAGFSSLLGAGIAVGFAAHFLDESARVVIELKHLQVETGISIETLSGLRAIAQQMAIPFDSMQTALIRMQRAQVLAVQGNKMLQLAFQGVGISVEQLKTSNPEQLFFALAKGMAEVPQKQVAITTGMQVMGRGAYTLIPLLREQGTTLQQLTIEAGRNSGITDKAAESAMKWHQMTAQLAQTFQSFMIPVLEVVIPLVKALQTAFESVATVIITAFEAVGTAIVAVYRDVKAMGTLLADIFTGNWGALAADARHVMTDMGAAFKDGGKEIAANWKALHGEVVGIWAKPLEIKQPEIDNDLSQLPQLGGGGGKDAMAKFREQLDQMRDAQTGFHELSKTEEADFWKAKLDIARGTPALYRQVYHEYVAAERSARKESLGEEVSAVEQRVQAERTGSLERIIILQEEASHLRSIGAEETAEYKRIQQQLSTAQRENTSENEREFSDRLKSELSSTKSATEQLSIIRHAQLQAELLGFSTEGESFKTLKDRELAAERLFVEQQRAIAAIDSDAGRAKEQNRLDIRRAALATEASVGLISQTQRINTERQIIAEEIALERQALQEKAALYSQDPVEYERVQKQLLALTDKYAKLMAQADNEELKQRMAGWQKFSGEFSSGFASAVGRMVETGKGFGQILANTWNSILSGFAQSLTKMVADWVLKHTLMLAVSKLFGAQEIAHKVAVEGTKSTVHAAGEATQTATTAAGESSRTSIGIAGTIAHIARTAAKVLAHIAGEIAQTAATVAGAAQRAAVGVLEALKSIGRAAAVAAAHAFKWAMEAVPFPFNLVVAPAAAVGAFAGVMAYKSLASAAGGALLDKDTLLQAHEGELIVPKQFVPTVLSSVSVMGGSGGVGIGGTGGLASSVSRELSTSTSTSAFLGALPKTELALPGAIRAQFTATQASGLITGKAEKGALLPRDMNIAGHARELVLPAHISTGLQNLISVGGLNTPPALNQNFNNIGGAASTSSSSATTHNHYNSVAPRIAVTVNGTSDGMKDLHDTVVKTIKRALRNGQLSFENA